MKCKNCGMEVDGNSFKRCPRCNTAISQPHKCSECKGCSLLGGGKREVEYCQSKEKSST